MLRLGKMKCILDVVEDMDDLAQALKATADCFDNLAHSAKTVAEAIRDNYSTPAEKPKSANTPAPKPLTIEDVRAILRPRIPIAGQDAIQDLLRKHGAPLLSNIAAEKYAALVEDAKALVSDEQVSKYLTAQKEKEKANAS